MGFVGGEYGFVAFGVDWGELWFVKVVRLQVLLLGIGGLSGGELVVV